MLSRLLIGYSRLLVKFPWLVLGAITLLFVASCAALYFTTDLPDFSDPIKGFKSRGTEVFRRYATLERFGRLMADNNSLLTVQPPISSDDLLHISFPSEDLFRLIRESMDVDTEAAADESGFHSDGEHCLFLDEIRSSGRNVKLAVQLGSRPELDVRVLRQLCHIDSLLGVHRMPFRCPRASLTMASLAAEILHKNCTDIDSNDLASLNELIRTCPTVWENSTYCCTALPPPDCTAMMSSCCTERSPLEDLLYLVLELPAWRAQPSLPPVTLVHLFQRIEDRPQLAVHFYRERIEARLQLNSELRIVAVDLGSDAAEFALYSAYLVFDIVWCALAMGVIICVMLAYVRSCILTASTFAVVVMSYAFSYFIYTVYAHLEHFPFLNILTLLVLIAVAGDDVFIFHDIWHQEKAKVAMDSCLSLRDDGLSSSAKFRHHHDEFLALVMVSTLRDASLSIFVTSLTTASAFLANLISTITDMRLFAIFAFLCLLLNFTLMISWIPAAMVLVERSDRSWCRICNKPDDQPLESSLELSAFNSAPSSANRSHRVTRSLTTTATASQTSHVNSCSTASTAGHSLCSRASQLLSRAHDAVYGRWLSTLLVRFYPVCLLLAAGLVTGAALLVFHSPRFTLSEEVSFQQYFSDAHPNTVWYNRYQERFGQTVALRNRRLSPMHAYFVWGVEPVESRDWWDPDRNGTLRFRNRFDPFAPDAAAYMLHFVDRLAARTDLLSEAGRGALLSMRTGFAGAARACHVPSGDDLEQPGVSQFMKKLNLSPFSPVFHQTSFQCCGRKTPLFVNATLSHLCIPLTLAARSDYGQAFSAAYVRNSSLRTPPFALLLDLETRQPASFVYREVRDFYDRLQRFVAHDDLQAAGRAPPPPPADLGPVWVTSNVSRMVLNDLQEALLHDTLPAVLLSAGVAFLVMIVMTLDILLTLYALTTISAAICSTIASMVLMGWHLNVLEALVITLAVGLSIDFTIHFGVAFRLSPHNNRANKVKDSLKRVGSAVTFAALTTFLAGLCITASSTHAYFQLGRFLTVCMPISLLFSLILFLPLCRWIGPTRSLTSLCCSKSVSDGV